MTGGRVITIGNFDGVHLGHQALLARAKAIATQRQASVTAMTFDPLPLAVLRPDHHPPLLMNLPDRVATLRAHGADEVVVLHPTPALLDMPPLDFLKHLAAQYRPVAIVEGTNFRFGKGRQGDGSTLQKACVELGWELALVEPVRVTMASLLSTVVSSTTVRGLVQRGRMEDARRCMARPYSLAGRVVRGEQRGRTIGFPTANLDPASVAQRCLPGDGVYAGVAILPDNRCCRTAVSVGIKPTFGHRQRVIEAHLLDYSGELYDQAITIQFTHWLRDQQPFPDVQTLVAQLKRDVARVRTMTMPDSPLIEPSIVVNDQSLPYSLPSTPGADR